MAQFAWTVYRDLSASNENPTPETIARKIRLEVSVRDSVSMEQRDRMIAIVVEELGQSRSPWGRHAAFMIIG